MDQDTVLQLPLVVGAVQASAIVLDATSPVSSSQSFVVASTAGVSAPQEVPAPAAPTGAGGTGAGAAAGAARCPRVVRRLPLPRPGWRRELARWAPRWSAR